MPTTSAARRLLFAAAASAGVGATGCLHVVRDRPAVPSAHTPCVAHACGTACDTHDWTGEPAPHAAPTIDYGADSHKVPPAPAPPAYRPAVPDRDAAPMPAPPTLAPPPSLMERDAGRDLSPPPPAPLLTPAGYTRIATPRR